MSPLSITILALISLNIHPSSSFYNSMISSPCNRTEHCLIVIGGQVECTILNGCQCKAYHIPLKQLGLGREECLPIARKGPLSLCKNDEQCLAGMGLFSRCFKSSYPFNCQCYDKGTNSTDNLIYSKVKELCVPKKSLGDECESDDECKESLGKGGICKDFVCFLRSSGILGIKPFFNFLELTFLLVISKLMVVRFWDS